MSKSHNKNYDVIVIGAGAAGMMCAIEAGKRGRKVFLLDHANKPGKKILMSGGGRCNFTNLNVTPANYLSHNPHFCRSALARYMPQDFIDLVERYQIPYHEKALGQLFCDNKAKDIVNMLLSECEANYVTLELNTPIKTIDNQDKGWLVTTASEQYQVDSVVIASGGLSIPTLGASPFGYQIAEQFGHHIYPLRAALVPFTLHQDDKQRYERLSGIGMDCEVSCQQQDFKEAMLFTHRGLSGPAMLQISSYWQAGDELQIKLQPNLDLYNILQTKRKTNPKQMLSTLLNDYFPKRVVETFVAADSKLADCSNNTLQLIANRFQAWQIKPNNTEGYRTAEVTLGGINCDEVSSKTFESHLQPNLYFIGEVLDVTGWLGGYNFQWAWASGYAAGQYC